MNSFFTVPDPPTSNENHVGTVSLGARSIAYRLASEILALATTAASLVGYVDLNHGPRPYQGRALTD